MATKRPIYETTAARRFRAVIRPSLVGNIGRAEPRISMRMADELFYWLNDVIRSALKTTTLSDEKNALQHQLLSGVRVTGRASMLTLRGRIDVSPWIFPHEFGGTLRPKHGSPVLTIPIYYALRSDGTPKFRSANSWRRFGSFIYTPKGSDTSFIAYKSASGELRVLYVLKEQVDIPARLGLNRMANNQLSDLLYAWRIIYVQEAYRAGIQNPWE